MQESSNYSDVLLPQPTSVFIQSQLNNTAQSTEGAFSAPIYKGGITYGHVGDIIDHLNQSFVSESNLKNKRLIHQAKKDIIKRAIADVSHSPKKRKTLSDILQAKPNRDIPWREVIPEAKGIAFLYNFSPFQDTGATVASKRIRNFEITFDVVSCSFLHRKKQDLSVECIADPYIASKHFLPIAPSWASWEPFKTFAIKACDYAEKRVSAGASYTVLYSRAMWAPSMFAAKLFKENHPELHWIAEFSDPMSLDVEGLPRGGKVPKDDLSDKFIQELEQEYPELSCLEFSIFSLAEHLVYAFADEIMFTNSNQMKEMVSRISCPSLRERVIEKAVVSNHPTLPRTYYLREDSGYEVDEAKLNLGYFGEFYSSRSITEVTSAIRTLPVKLRERVHLHVFTNFIPTGPGNQRPRNMSRKQHESYVRRAYEGVGAEGIENQVSFNASLPYLKFLATTEKLDYLIVNDAKTGAHHSVNPFLPSKWSDYAGSSAKSWGFVEPNSILASKPVTVKSPVGDALNARVVLWDLVEQKFPDLASDLNG